MDELIAKCGFDCGRCPSYKGNVKTRADKKRCSSGWHRYHGFKLSPEKILRCEGCLVPAEENPVRYLRTGCRVRRCAVRNNVENCAYCSEYPCEDVTANSAYIDREKIAARLGGPIPEGDYLTYIEPYEGLNHLDSIRESLSPKDVVQAAKVSIEPKVTEFPDGLSLSMKETSALRALHSLIGSVGAAKGISYARQEALTKKRLHMLKILWAFGLEGRLERRGGLHLEIDAKTYLAQKIQSEFSRLKDLIRTMKKYGVRVEHVVLEEKGWLTPKGSLRGKGWQLRMTLTEKAGGPPALKALQKYVSLLNRKHGKNAFRRFARGNMRVFQHQ